MYIYNKKTSLRCKKKQRSSQVENRLKQQTAPSSAPQPSAPSLAVPRKASVGGLGSLHLGSHRVNKDGSRGLRLLFFDFSPRFCRVFLRSFRLLFLFWLHLSDSNVFECYVGIVLWGQVSGLWVLAVCFWFLASSGLKGFSFRGSIESFYFIVAS